ncbi:uncharacterized protein HGUI_00162 [Hanseniaspora guilliermondii]|uniref:Killer toxin-resistance protein 5 n=1 Tax=Hanseniaspora guilliermondii TaxID=56406 RepID=A0A1L0ATU2_9ASCO|nr:uncharacterized protein HGUI_00162 [Hanseniaspora guilliermondii]
MKSKLMMKSFASLIFFMIGTFSICFSFEVSHESDSLKVWNSFMKMYPILSVINSDESFLQRQDIVNYVVEEVMLQDQEEESSTYSNVYKYLYQKSPMLANVYKSYYDTYMPLILNKSPYKTPQFILNGESFDLDEIYYLKTDKLTFKAEFHNSVNTKQPIIGSVEGLIKNLDGEIDQEEKFLYQAKYINTEKPLIELHCSLSDEFFELFVMEALEGKFNLVWYDTSNITFYDPKNTESDTLYELKFDNVKGLTLNNTDIVSDATFTDKQRSNKKGFLSNLDNLITLNAIEKHSNDTWESLDYIFNSTNNLVFNDYQQNLVREFNLNKEEILSQKDDILVKDLYTLKQNGISYDNLGFYLNGMNILNHHASQMSVLDAITHELEMMNGLRNSITKVFPQLNKQVSIQSIKKLLLEYEVMYSKLSMFNQPRKFDLQKSEDDKEIVLFVNDLENDFQYKDLNTDLHKFLSSSHEKEFPGMKENWNDIVFLLDMNNTNMLRDFIRVITVISDGFPQRIGFIPLTDDLDLLNKILQVYRNPIKLANLLKDPSVRTAKPKYDKKAKELKFNIDKLLHDMNINDNEALIVNGEIFPYRENTWNYYITSVMNKDIQFIKTFFQNMEYRGESFGNNTHKIRDVLYSESFSFIERDLTLTPDYFGDAMVTRTNYDFILELREMGHVFEFIKDTQYEIIHSITYVADFSNIKEWRNIFNLVQNNLYGVRIRLVTLCEPSDKHWKKLQELLHDDAESFSNYIEKHESNEINNIRPLPETVDLSNWLLDLSYKQLQSQRFVVLNGRFVDLSSYSDSISTQSWFNFIKFESFKTLQTATALNIAFKFEENYMIPMQTIEDIVSHLTYFSHRELSQGKENYEQGVHYTAETVQTRHPINQVLLHVEADKNIDIFLNSKNFKKDSATKPIDLILVIDPIEERSSKFIKIVKTLKPLKKYINLQILLMPTTELTIFPRQTYFATFDELKSSLLDKASGFEVHKVPKYKKLENHKIENINESIILADVYVQKPINSIKGCTRTTVETDMTNVCIAIVSDDDSADEICRVLTMSTFGFSQIRIPVSESRAMKVVSCDPRYEVTNFTLDMNSDLTIWENFYTKDLLTRSVLVHVSEKSNEKEDSTFNRLSVLAIVQNQQDLIKLSKLLLNKDNKYIVWNTQSSGFSKEEILNYLPKQFDISVINFNWADWIRPTNLISHQMKFAKFMLVDVNIPVEVDDLLFIDLETEVDDKWVNILKAGSLSKFIGIEDIVGLEKYTDDDNTEKYWTTEEYWTKYLETNELDSFFKTNNYVMRMKKFRTNGYGDILRVHYQRLTTDINSLGKLDESLMNNAQTLISIGPIQFSNSEIDLDEL